MIRTGSGDLLQIALGVLVHCFEIEGGIFFIQEVACPETNHCVTDFQIRSPVECAIERLADIVLFSPVDASGSVIISLEYNPVEDRARTAGDGVFSSDI